MNRLKKTDPLKLDEIYYTGWPMSFTLRVLC